MNKPPVNPLSGLLLGLMFDETLTSTQKVVKIQEIITIENVVLLALYRLHRAIWRFSNRANVIAADWIPDTTSQSIDRCYRKEHAHEG